MATASELIDAANAATTTEQLDEIEAQAEGRVTVTAAVEDARARLEAYEQTKTLLGDDEQPTPPEGHDDDPDFVWVGCSACWQPRDTSRAVRSYAEWLSDGYRHLTYYCTTCSERDGVHTEVHPSLLGIWMEDTHFWQEGGVAAPASEVKRWGV